MKYPDSVFSEEVEFPIYGFNLRATCSGREGALPPLGTYSPAAPWLCCPVPALEPGLLRGIRLPQ